MDGLLARIPAISGLFGAHAAFSGDETLLADHVIVAGYGRVGRQIVAGLREVGLPVAVIESDFHLVQELGRQQIPAIYGDASYVSVLAAAHPELALSASKQP